MGTTISSSPLAIRDQAMPPKRPREERKQALTITIEPQHRQWIRENYKALGFRSESHAIDEAIRLLIAERSKDSKRPGS